MFSRMLPVNIGHIKLFLNQSNGLSYAFLIKLELFPFLFAYAHLA